MAKTKVPGGYISDEAITSAHLHSSHGITTNDIGEHTNNKYYTDARVDARLAASKSANFLTTGSITAGKVILASGNKIIFGGDDAYNAHLQYTDNGSGDHFLSIKTEHNDTITERAKFHAGTGAITFSGDTSFGDNIKVNFGTGSDLQIYHDGSYSYIREVGTGDLRLAGASNVQIWNSNIDSQMANFANGGAATLYYAGAAKLATTSAGAAVTGNLSVSGNLTVTGTTTTVDTVTMNAQNAVVFEGATADAHETTLTIIDPTADRTINLPNQSGTIPVLAAASNTAITATPAELNYVDGVTSAIQTQLDSKQATISSSTDLTLSSIVASSSNESRFNALSIGPDADIYLYQSATNEFTIRTGTSGAYKYFTFESGGNLNLLSGGLETGGTERISSGGNLTNIGTISSGTITTSGNIIMNSSQYIDLNGSNIIDVEQIVGIGSSGWLDFNMDTDNVYPQSTTDNQTVLGSVTHMNFVGDSNANGTGGTFNFGYGVSHTDSGTFTKTMDLDRSGNLTVIGALTGTSLDINGTGDVSGDLTVGNVKLTSTGSIELERSGGAFIDFKTSNVDFDSRIMGGSSLTFTTGGSGSTATALTLGSDQSATFAGTVSVTNQLSISGTTDTIAYLNVTDDGPVYVSYNRSCLLYTSDAADE